MLLAKTPQHSGAATALQIAVEIGEKTKSLSEALLTEALIFSRSLGGSLLARGLLWYSTKLKNILGDFGNRPGFRSSLHEHIGFHDLATDWPQ
ncbi:MAG: hypothetical protein DME76_11175 [Verrucomicrobia bacterium]|nr:MAG: hypothetical protein DME76_11175 [Verrucomicrobiota bacterium]